jgi:hypothetical protein
MSSAIVQSILDRAAADAEFRTRLLQSPSSTLADYALSAREVLALRSLTAESFTTEAAGHETPESKSAQAFPGA